MKTRRYLYCLSFILLACSEEAPSSDNTSVSRQTVTVQQPEEDPYKTMRGGMVGGGDHHPGKIIYDEHCAQCHTNAISRAPHISFLQMLPGDMILHTMENGIMRPMSAKLSPQDKVHVAQYLAGEANKTNTFPPVKCDAERAKFDYAQHPLGYGWGITRENSRYIDAQKASLTKGDVKNLRLKWAFAFPGMSRARSQVSLAGGAVYVGSQDGTVYSLNADTGCVRWTFRASAEVRTGITISDWTGDEKTKAPPLVFFADLLARTYALNAVTGELRWMKKVDDHPAATATAQPVLYKDTLYQPSSSLEEAAAAEADYACCSFRGSITAFDPRSGGIKWKRYLIRADPRQVGTTSVGTRILAPSGSPIWNSPTIDEKREVLYVGTGNNYSSPSEDTHDAIIALDVNNGEIKWVRQTTSGDAWNVACFPFSPSRENCPEEAGPDVDYAAAVMHIKFEDKEILIGAQKSGDVYGIDPDSTEIIWDQKVARGGNQGGINFGLAAEADKIFVPVADYDDGILPIEDARPGIYALDAFTGDPLWSNPAENHCAERKDCDPGISAPVTAIPGVVFAGHLDGWLRAYDTETGELLWEYDTYQKMKTLSGEIASGGSMSGGAGPIIADGKVYMTSGYGIYFHMPGNVLMMFAADQATQ